MTLSFLFSSLSLATSRAPEPGFEVRKLPGGALRITASAQKGFHFNRDAPQSVLAGKIRFKPSLLEESRVSFTLAGGGRTALSFTLYLCDDAKSFCERQVIEAEWTGQELSLGKKSAPTAAAAPAAAATATAIERARRENKPLLMDFFGIWCPPCNRLDSEVFNQPEFERAAKDFVHLKLDADDPASWELKSRYKVGGYPTVVFATSQGEEISRVVGYRPLADFVAETRKAYALRGLAGSELRAKAAEGDRDAADRLGLMHLERREFAEAERWLAGTRGHREQWHSAVIGARGGESVEAYEKALAEFPETPDSLSRRSELAALLKKAGHAARAQALLGEAIQVARELIRRPERLKGHEMSVADLWANVADLQQTLGLGTEARASWKKAAAEYDRAQPAPSERGGNLELAYCLYMSGDFARAERIYRTLEKAYPGEFTFYFAHARMELERKALKPARELASLAYERSYGDNRLRAAHLLARIQSEAGAAREALALLERTLQEASVPADPTIRTHRYVTQVRELRAELARAK